MKQTLEEAAKKHQNGFPTCEDESVLGAFSNGMHHQSYKSFIVGAEWHAKQPLWINVKERLPEYEGKVLVLYEYEGEMQIQELFYIGEKRMVFGSSEVLAWMPIPSFDEILEANRDVLERIKEKGD